MQRLVTVENAEARPTPVLLLSALRDIDPLVDLVYAGERRWWLGAVRENSERRRKGENILEQMAKLDNHRLEEPHIARYVMLGKLATQGFALIETYFGNDPSGVVTVAEGTPHAYQCSMIEDFRERQIAFERDGGEENAIKKIKLALGDEQQDAAEAEIRAYLASDGRDHYRREVRNRVTMGYGGSTGGSGRILIPG